MDCEKGSSKEELGVPRGAYRLHLPNLLTDLDEAGFSGVVCTKMQVKRVYASTEGNNETISHTC